MTEETKKSVSIRTARFGEISVDAATAIEIQGGLLGFPHSIKYAVLDQEEDSPFKWLQSLDQGEVAFVVTDPLIFFPDYEVKVRMEELATLNIDDPKDFAVFVILSLIGGVGEMTANLQGPIVINVKTRTGRQIILRDSGYQTKHPLFPKTP